MFVLKDTSTGNYITEVSSQGFHYEGSLEEAKKFESTNEFVEFCARRGDESGWVQVMSTLRLIEVSRAEWTEGETIL